MRSLSIILGLTALLFVSCYGADDDDVVATAYKYKLLRSDLAGIVPEGASEADSLEIITAYVNQWVDRMVLVSKAEKNVKEDFSEQLENYRNSLLIYAFEQQIINQNIDTLVSDADVSRYYEEHLDDFVLLNPIVRVVYVKLPFDCSEMNKVKALMNKALMTDDDILDLQRVAARTALEMSFDVESWSSLNALQDKIPASIAHDPMFFRQSHFCEMADSMGVNMVHFIEYKLADEYAPVELESDNIRTIILNRRKVELVRNMRKDLRRLAEENKKVSINLEY